MTDNESQHQKEEADAAPQWLVVPSEVAVRSIAHAIEKRKRDVTITGHGAILVAFHQFLSWLFHTVMRNIKSVEWRNKSE